VMPDGVLQNLVNAAHANLKAARDAKASLGGSTDSQSPSGDSDIDDIIKALNPKK